MKIREGVGCEDAVNAAACIAKRREISGEKKPPGWRPGGLVGFSI